MAAKQPRRHPLAVDRDTALAILARDLARHRARAGRLWQQYQAIDESQDAEASRDRHHSWSDVVEEALVLSEQISQQQVHDLGELAIQFEAIWWWVVEDDSILDESARRWLTRFRRSLRRLAANS